jgi:dTDP-4-dehydrorhamnose reductase
MKTLITGGSGILGIELKKFFPNSLFPSHSELDITNHEMVFDYFSKNEFDSIIHAAAMTSVRQCESEKKLSWSTNVVGTKNLVDAAIKFKPNSKFSYVSTACVFDGHVGMYKESSIPYPENFYALTKLIGEQQIKNLKNYLIIRTNFKGKQKWPYPKAFTDRFGTYLFADQVALGINDIIKENIQGVVHIVGKKKISMFELAQLTTPDIKPLTIDEYQGPPLTMDMSLDTERWKKYTLK